MNLRDAGTLSGLPAGRIYRSDDPRTRPFKTCERLRKLGIRTIIKLNAHQDVFDLSRRPKWRRGPCAIPELAVPLPHSRTRGAAGMSIDKIAAKMRQGPRRTVQFYMRKQLKVTLQHLSRLPPGRFPVLFNCSLGRDRTGVVLAMLQTLAGASPAAVERDYVESRQNVGGASVHVLRRVMRQMHPVRDFLQKKLQLDNRTVRKLEQILRAPRSPAG